MISKENAERSVDNSEDQLPNIFLTPFDGMAVIFLEKLSISLYDVIEQTKNGKKNFTYYERFNLLYQAVKGLEIMDEYFLHCNIKPQTIMLKQVNKDEIVDMAQAGLPPASSTGNEHFQLKFVDFGMIAIGDKGTRRCSGGNFGFLPNEFIIKNSPTEKLDVYSLGMSFLDLELAQRGLSEFSKIDQILYKTTKNNQLEIDSSDVTKLNNFNLVIEMKKLIAKINYRNNILEILEQKYPDYKVCTIITRYLENVQELIF